MTMVSSRVTLTIGRYVFWVIATACAGCNQPEAVLTRLLQAQHFASEAIVHFTKAGNAADRAVMADTDETSVAFAREAEKETLALESDLAQLAPIARGLHYSDETTLLEAFRSVFAKYRALDREILALAVENSNLKAQRLSFGPGQDAANALRDALEAAARGAPAADACRVRALVATSVAAVREIQVLQAPHIAASEDEAMTAFEKQMSEAEADARSALRELASIDRPQFQSALAAANAALTRFLAVHGQILALSRHNSNVRSLALSLGQKRTLTAACEANLRALRDRLAKRSFSATR
jgi:hypothetical protein